MRAIFLVFILTIAFSANAEIYKCVKAGKTSYGEKRCDDSAGKMNPTKSPVGLNEGLAAFESGKFEIAYKRLSPLADNGVALAQNTVGKMYLQGQGVPKDPGKALVLFRSAAKQGLPNAKNNLGIMYAAGEGVPQDYGQALVWFRAAANQGFSLAMNNLADMYENGLGVKPNAAEADKWRKKSQDTGSTTNSTLVATETVGRSEYDQGLALYYKWDFVGAAEWFQKAAAKGHPEAQLKLATMYQHGQGVRKSEEQALYWSRKAREGAHTMDDGRDRVIIFDSSSEAAPEARAEY